MHMRFNNLSLGLSFLDLDTLLVAMAQHFFFIVTKLTKQGSQ